MSGCAVLEIHITISDFWAGFALGGVFATAVLFILAAAYGSRH